MKTKNNYSYSDLGLMIGMVTCPVDSELKKFFDEEIKSTYDYYKNSLSKMIQDRDLDEHLYCPEPYYLFGKYDIAFLSLIDDSEFCGRAFRAFNNHRGGNNTEGYIGKPFDHKIIDGSLSLRGKTTINELAESTFLKKRERYPLIGICTLKLDNILLLEYGYQQLHNAFLDTHQFINNNIDNTKKENGIESRIILIESDGASEYTVILFSNSFRAISKYLLQIRSTVYDVENNIVQTPYETTSGSAFEKENNSEIYTLFEYSSTQYGFHYEIFKEYLNSQALETSQGIKLKSILKNKSFNTIPDKNIEGLLALDTRYAVRPGSYKKLQEVIDKSNNYKSDYYRITLGFGDIIPSSRDYEDTKTQMDSLLQQYRTLEEKKLLADNIVTEIRSMPVIQMHKPNNSLEKEKFSKDCTEILDLLEKNNHLKDTKYYKIIEQSLKKHFIPEEIDDLNEFENAKNTFKKFVKFKNTWLISDRDIVNFYEYPLKRIGVAKVVRNKVVKILANYNNSASNPVTFLFFLDMSFYLKETLKETISSIEKKVNEYKVSSGKKGTSLGEVNVWLARKCRLIELAYYNRFFQSSVNKDLTDFNSEYYGAIQQKIFVYGYFSNTYTGLFIKKDNNPAGLVLVGSTPRIESSLNFVKISFFHVFQPEVYASICFHEASNFFSDRLLNHGREIDEYYKSLGGIKYESIENDAEEYDPHKTTFLTQRDLIEFGFKNEELSDQRGKDKQEDFSYSLSNMDKQIWDMLKKEDDYYLHEEFIKDIFYYSQGFFKTVSKDFITFYAGYLGDAKLFYRWHWNYFLQIQQHYDTDHNMKTNKFRALLARILFVLRNQDTGSKYLSTEEFNSFIGPNKFLQKLWFENYPHANWFINKLKENKFSIGFTEKFNFFAKLIVVKNKNLLLDFSGVQNEEIEIQKIKNDYSSIVDSIQSASVNGKHSIIEKFVKGEVVSKNKEETDYTFISKLNYAILKYYIMNDYDLWDDEFKKEFLLERLKGQAIPNKNYADVLIDRQGGVFCVNANRRRELFRFRTAFVKSLYDASLRKNNEIFIKN